MMPMDQLMIRDERLAWVEWRVEEGGREGGIVTGSDKKINLAVISAI